MCLFWFFDSILVNELMNPKWKKIQYWFLFLPSPLFSQAKKRKSRVKKEGRRNLYPQGWSCWGEGDFFGCTFRSWSALIIRISEGTLLMLNGNKRLYFEITLYIHIQPWIHTYISNACVWERTGIFSWSSSSSSSSYLSHLSIFGGGLENECGPTCQNL